MTVVVVNCSAWATFPGLVQSRALDLYRPDQGVEFWHVAVIQGDDAQMRVWGNWPKCFGEPLWLLGDELWDVVTSHDAAVSDASGAEAPEPLTVVVVLDPGMTPRRRRGGQQSTATAVMKTMNALADRIAADVEHEAAIRRSLWRIAVLRTSGAGPATNADTVAAEAWSLVKPRTAPAGPQGGAVSTPEAFDTAIVIERGSGEANFDALRMVIDIARDGRTRDALKPGAGRREQKVIKLAPPRVRQNPSDRILFDLATLAQEYEKSPIRDEAANALPKLVYELKEKTFLKDARRLSETAQSAAAKGKGRRADYDASTDLEREYFSSTLPELTDLTVGSDVKAAAAILKAADDRLQPFLTNRNENLRKMRGDQDKNIRYYKQTLEGIEAATIDRNFGQAGEMPYAIEKQSVELEELQDDFVVRATTARNRLVDEYGLQLEPARTEYRHAPLLSDFKEYDVFKDARTDFEHQLANAATHKRFAQVGLIFAAFYALLVLMILTFGRRGPVSAWSTVQFAFAVGIAMIGVGVVLFWECRRCFKRRTQALSKVQDSYEAIVNRLDSVTLLALAHVATSRIAGRLEPFTRLLSYRIHDLRELRVATRRVFDAIRTDTNRKKPTAKTASAPQPFAFESKLKDAEVHDYLKIALNEFPASEVKDVDITFKGGEMSGGIVVRTALVLENTLDLTFVGEPEAAASPNANVRAAPASKTGRREAAQDKADAGRIPAADGNGGQAGAAVKNGNSNGGR
jgi:hypothetical protein